MEILHDVRTPRGVRLTDTRPLRIVAALAAGVLAACGGGGARADKTADTAVVIGEAKADSVLTGTGDTAADSAGRAKGEEERGDSSGILVPAPPSLILHADSAAGFSLYLGRGRCASCHGPLGRGMATLGSDLTDTTWLTGNGSVASIQQIVIDGVAVPKQEPIAMPSYVKRLTPGDAFRIAAYVYTLSHPGSVVADTSHAPAVARPATDTTRPPL